MTSVERVKEICKERKIPISKLEKDLQFANGYIGQLKKGTFPDDRIYMIADYLGVSVDFIRTGTELEERECNDFEAKDSTERKILMLCRKAGDVSKEEKEDIVSLFESTIDLYLKAKGIKKE